MQVDSQHPVYKARLKQWKRCRDVYEGSDAVKDAGEAYLPRPMGQSLYDFNAYKERAMFYGAFNRSVEGYVGSIARKAPKLDAPEAMEFVIDDITASGIGLLEFIKTVSAEALITGRVGVQVDFDEALGRPFLTYYKAEQIINWFADGGVMIEETVYEADPKDQFCMLSVQQWRHLGLIDGVYTVTLYRKRNSHVSNEFYVYSQIQPNLRAKTFGYIPFFFLSRKGAASGVDAPPLLTLADVVLSHYKTSADLEHGRHFSALPTLYITGMNGADNGPIRIGSSEAIILQDPQAKVGYAEFTGAGLASLDKGLEQKEHQMAVLGAALFGSKGGVEAAETARIRTNGENSLLSSIVSSTEEVLEACLKLMAEWMGVSYDIDLHINRDFVGERIAAPEILALVKAYASGAITLEVFLHNLQTGEMLPPEMDVDEQAAELKAAAESQAAQAMKMAAETNAKTPAQAVA